MTRQVAADVEDVGEVAGEVHVVVVPLEEPVVEELVARRGLEPKARRIDQVARPLTRTHPGRRELIRKGKIFTEATNLLFIYRTHYLKVSARRYLTLSFLFIQVDHNGAHFLSINNIYNRMGFPFLFADCFEISVLHLDF